MWVVGSLTGTHIHDGSIPSEAKKKKTFKSDSQVKVEWVWLKTADCGKVSETIFCAWGSKCCILHCAVNNQTSSFDSMLHKLLHPNVPNPHYKLINRLEGKKTFWVIRLSAASYSIDMTVTVPISLPPSFYHLSAAPCPDTCSIWEGLCENVTPAELLYIFSPPHVSLHLTSFLAHAWEQHSLATLRLSR